MLDPVARRLNGRPVYARVGGSDDPAAGGDDFLYYWEFDNGHNWIIRWGLILIGRGAQEILTIYAEWQPLSSNF